MELAQYQPMAKTRGESELKLGKWLAVTGTERKAIAEAADITLAYLHELIVGKKKNPSRQVLVALADYLGTTPDGLYEDPPSREAIQAAQALLRRPSPGKGR